MDREQLNQRHHDVIVKHWRNLTDTGGQPTLALLDDLAAIANEHARGLDDEHRGETSLPAARDASSVAMNDTVIEETPAAAEARDERIRGGQPARPAPRKPQPGRRPGR